MKGTIYHSIFLSVIVANLTSLTMYTLAVLEVFLGMFLLTKAYRLKKSSVESTAELATLVQQIVIFESLKIIIPLAYLGCFSVAFVGPNADTLGNVKNSYWQFQAVENLWTPTKMLLILVAIDIFISLLTGLVMYFLLKINLLHVYVHICKEYGNIFTWQTAYILKYLFCWISVGCALDLTFQFDWISNKEKWRNMIRASHNYTEDIWKQRFNETN